jgi:hypothetical protein
MTPHMIAALKAEHTRKRQMLEIFKLTGMDCWYKHVEDLTYMVGLVRRANGDEAGILAELFARYGWMAKVDQERGITTVVAPA